MYINIKNIFNTLTHLIIYKHYYINLKISLIIPSLNKLIYKINHNLLIISLINL